MNFLVRIEYTEYGKMIFLADESLKEEEILKSLFKSYDIIDENGIKNIIDDEVVSINAYGEKIVNYLISLGYGTKKNIIFYHNIPQLIIFFLKE